MDVLVVAADSTPSTPLCFNLGLIDWLDLVLLPSTCIGTVACIGSCCSCFTMFAFRLRSLPYLKLLSWLLECDRSMGVVITPLLSSSYNIDNVSMTSNPPYR